MLSTSVFRGRTYDGWAYSPLDQIDRENVRNLQLVWSRALNAGQVELSEPTQRNRPFDTVLSHLP